MCLLLIVGDILIVVNYLEGTLAACLQWFYKLIILLLYPDYFVGQFMFLDMKACLQTVRLYKSVSTVEGK